jgi:hypothetical protein
MMDQRQTALVPSMERRDEILLETAKTCVGWMSKETDPAKVAEDVARIKAKLDQMGWDGVRNALGGGDETGFYARIYR